MAVYEGTRQWGDLNVTEQDRFLLSCIHGNRAYEPVMKEVGLKWYSAHSIAGKVCPSGSPPRDVSEIGERTRWAIKYSPLRERFQQALDRAAGKHVDEPTQETKLHLASSNGSRLENEPHVWLGGTAFVAAILALLPMPYEYYLGMKGFFFFCTIAGLYPLIKERGLKGWWPYIALFVLWLNNPIYPLSMAKEAWAFYNFLSALTVLALMGTGKTEESFLRR